MSARIEHTLRLLASILEHFVILDALPKLMNANSL